MSKGVRLVVAVIVSTLSVAPIYFIMSILTGDLDNDFLFPALTIATVFAFLGVLFVGLPVHFLLIWKNWLRPVHYLVPGFIFPSSIVAILRPFGGDGVLGISWQALLMGVFGAVVALIFRRVALGKSAPDGTFI